MAEKASKETANYREATTLGKRCLLCSMYRFGTCTAVEGQISPLYVCDYWEFFLTGKAKPSEG